MRILKKFIIFGFILLSVSAHLFAQWSDDEVYELVKTGTFKDLKKALKKNKDAPNKRFGYYNDTLLMVAVENSRELEIIDLLLNYDISPDLQNDNGDTALMYAAKNSSGKKILNALITYNTNFNSQRKKRVAIENNQGQTALDFAQDGSEEKALLEKFSDKPKEKSEKPAKSEKTKEKPEKKTKAKKGKQPQATAESWYSRKGRDVEIPIGSYEEESANQEETVAQESAEQEEAPAVEEAPEPELAAATEENEEEESADDEEEDEEYAEKEEESDEEEETAVAQEEPAQEESAPKHAAVSNQKTYLFDGIEPYDTYDEAESKKPLIQDPDKKDANGHTRLQIAAANDDVEMITQLLRSNANPNLSDEDSWTALMYAARFAKKRETVAALIKGGADLTARNRYGTNSLQIAAAYTKSAEVFDEFAKNSTKKDLKIAFFAAVGMGQKKPILEVFFKHGITPNMIYKGKTPLMYAAQSNTDTNCIKVLLEHGADKTFVTADRKDAYYFATRNPNLPRDAVYWSLNNSEKK